MSDCIFCKIIQGEIPAYKIYENSEFLAFLDISHFVDGHTLIIPKKHVRFIWDIDNLGAFYEFAKKVSNHFIQNIGYRFVDSISLGRKVPHAHLHLIPHNGDVNDWSIAMNKVGQMQEDTSRRLTKEKGMALVEKFLLED
jgi:histidine triad (HIT) family protein